MPAHQTTKNLRLILYNSKYKVLICLECQYAIQKSAIQSHLLRHRIYRGERQQILTSIAEHELLEPEDVVLPQPDSPPIEHLPVAKGYRCVVGDCGCLLTSTKRMKRHWSEAHGALLGDSVPDLASFAVTVDLQTFFRGTKLRYFEVRSSSASSEIVPDADKSDEAVVHDQDRDRRQDVVPSNAASPARESIDLDLESLRYLHHFMTSTGSTLPSHGEFHYWQGVVSQALSRRWLMCGILALSAWHQAMSSKPGSRTDSHAQYASRLSVAFFAQDPQWNDEEDCKVDKKIKESVQYLLQCLQTASTSCSEPPEKELKSILDTLRNCPWDLEAHSEEYGNPSLDVAEALSELPSRMAEVVEKPENPRDFFAVLSAIAEMKHCANLSFASERIEYPSGAMVEWLRKISEHFNHLISIYDPAALIVVGYWAAILVQRTENCGCWFLRGMTEKVLTLVAKCVAGNFPGARTLIEALRKGRIAWRVQAC